MPNDPPRSPAPSPRARRAPNQDRSAGQERPSAATAAADRVRASILNGEISPGAHLPGERDLSQQLGISRLTLRSALVRLEAEGLIRSVHGSGTRVLDFRETGSIDLVGYLARLALEGGTVPAALLADMLELRRMIAVELLGLVAVRATDDELGSLGRSLRRLEGAVGDPTSFMAADLAFARELVRCAKNLALELLFNTIVRAIDQHPGLMVAFQANAEQTPGVYQRLLELIATRDAAQVTRVARRLLDRLDRATMARVEALTTSMVDSTSQQGGQ